MGDNGKLKVVIKLAPQPPQQQASGHKHADGHRRKDKDKDKEKVKHKAKEKGKDKGKEEKDRDSERDSHRVKLKLKHADVKSSSRSGVKHSLSAVSEDEATDKQQEAVGRQDKDRKVNDKDRKVNNKEINSSRETEGPMPLKKRKFELPAPSSPEPELALSPAPAVVVPPTTTAATPPESMSFLASKAHYKSKVKSSPQPSADLEDHLKAAVAKDDTKVHRQDTMSVETSAPSTAAIPEPAPHPQPSSSLREPAGGADAPTVSAMEAILAKLQKKDTFGVFAEKVDPELVPDYYDVISNPMDFGTMKDKLKAGVYSTWDLFTADVNLICNNAMHYNAPHTVYFKQAKAMQELLYKSLSKEQQVIARKTAAATTTVLQSAPNLPAKRGRKPGAVPGRRGRPPGRLNRPPSDSEHMTKAVGDDSVDSRRANRSNADTSTLEPGTPGVDTDDFGERKPVSLQALDGRRPLPAEEYRRSTFVAKKPGNGRGVVCWDQLTLGQANSRVFAPLSNLPQEAYMASLCRFVGGIGGKAWAVASKKIAQVYEAELQALAAPPPTQAVPKTGVVTKAYVQNKAALPQMAAGRGTPAGVRGTAQVPGGGAGRGTITAARPPTPPVPASRVTTPPPNITTVRSNASSPAAASMQRTPSPQLQGQTSGIAMPSVSATPSAPSPSASIGQKPSPSKFATAQSASVPKQPLGSIGPGRPTGLSAAAQGNTTSATIAQRVISPNTLPMPASRPQPMRPSGGNSFGFDALFNNSNSSSSAPKTFDLNVQSSFPTQRMGPTAPASKGFTVQSNAGSSAAQQGFQATQQQQQQQQQQQPGGVQLPAGNYAYPPWMASSLAQMQQMSLPLQQQQQQQAMAAMLASQSGAQLRASAQHAQLGAMQTSASLGTRQDGGSSMAGQAADAQGKGQAWQQPSSSSGHSTWPIDFTLGLRPGGGSSGGK